MAPPSQEIGGGEHMDRALIRNSCGRQKSF